MSGKYVIDNAAADGDVKLNRPQHTIFLQDLGKFLQTCHLGLNAITAILKYFDGETFEAKK